MTKFNFTADELNAILGWGNDEVEHSDRWNCLRNKFADMDEDQFNEVYAAFYEGSTGIIRNPTAKLINEEEARVVCEVLNGLSFSDFPKSFSDAYYPYARPLMQPHGAYSIVPRRDTRDRVQKIIDTLEKTGAVEGLRVIKIMTQGKCHIKLYEIR